MHCLHTSKGWHTITAAERTLQFCPRVPQPPRFVARSTQSLAPAGSTQCPRTATEVQSSAQDFDDQLQQLTDWKAVFGTCYVPDSATDAAKLSNWVKRARRAARKGELNTQQHEQLSALGFEFTPNVVDAKWHHTYHRLRCLLDTTDMTVQQIQQLQQLPQQHDFQQWQQQCDPEQQQQHDDPLPPQQPQLQQQYGAEVLELSKWLQRQVELYGKLKLTPVKTKLLRKLGVKLKRQAGLTRDNLHPILQGKDSNQYKRRPIMVNAKTLPGRRAVGRLLRQWADWQQQQQGQQQQQQVFEVDDPDIAFMCMLADLQKWRKRYGSCIVPPGVWDRQPLAGWVQQVRDAKLAAGAAAAAGGQQSNSSDGSSQGTAAGSAAEEDCVQQQLDMQQQQCEVRGLLLTVSAVPETLKPWHLEELTDVGFVWDPSKVDNAWHEQYHRLRQYKVKHNSLATLMTAAAAAAGSNLQDDSNSAASTEAANSSNSNSAAGTKAAGSSSSSAGSTKAASGSRSSSAVDTNTAGSSSSCCNSEDWAGLAEWLQQQRELLKVARLQGSPALATAEKQQQHQQQGLTKLQRRLLKDLGVQPA